MRTPCIGKMRKRMERKNLGVDLAIFNGRSKKLPRHPSPPYRQLKCRLSSSEKQRLTLRLKTPPPGTTHCPEHTHVVMMPLFAMGLREGLVTLGPECKSFLCFPSVSSQIPAFALSVYPPVLEDIGPDEGVIEK